MTDPTPRPPEHAELVDGAWRLVGTRCTDCDAVHFPRSTSCSVCGGRNLEPAHLAGNGVVYSKTTLGMGPPGFEPPYGLAWVDLPEGPRAFGQLEDPDAVTIGDRVELTVGPVRRDPDGVPVLGHRFRKVAPG